jgi:hypothetical protein
MVMRTGTVPPTAGLTYDRRYGHRKTILETFVLVHLLTLALSPFTCCRSGRAAVLSIPASYVGFHRSGDLPPDAPGHTSKTQVAVSAFEL